jgi:hypothetical protein
VKLRTCPGAIPGYQLTVVAFEVGTPIETLQTTANCPSVIFTFLLSVVFAKILFAT